MNTVLIVTLIAAVWGPGSESIDVKEFYDNLQAESADPTPLAKYADGFRRMYEAFPNIELLKAVVDYLPVFGYGEGSAAITCGDSGRGSWTSCLDMLDMELASVNKAAAVVTFETVEKELWDYSLMSFHLLADFAEYEKMATADQMKAFAAKVGGGPIDMVQIPVTNHLACAIEFVYTGGQEIDPLYRVYDFFSDKSDKTKMSAEQLYELLKKISGGSAPEPAAVQPDMTASAYEERIQKHRNYLIAIRSKMVGYSAFCDKSNRWLNTHQLKWKFIKEWKHYNDELYAGFKMSTHRTKILNQVSSDTNEYHPNGPGVSINTLSN